MVEIQKPRIECIENVGEDAYGKYVVEPLERGYGTTIGNSLRRILLSGYRSFRASTDYSTSGESCNTFSAPNFLRIPIRKWIRI